MKQKVKLISVLTAVLFCANFLAIAATPMQAKDPSQIFKIDIMAKGVDLDISGAITIIKGNIEFDKVSGEPLGDINFHIKIYDESSEKIYSMKGKLKEGAVMVLPYWPCPVRGVTWTNLWYIMGVGELKTSDTDLTIDYRGQTITLPNTEGEYIPYTIMMLVSPNGEYVGGVYEGGGWAFAGIPGFGGVTYLTKYFEK
ncbi:MAG: hypothetical protein ACTSQ4_12210 [Candidatus Heimdallarchaeaceae archaeon]